MERLPFLGNQRANRRKTTRGYCRRQQRLRSCGNSAFRIDNGTEAEVVVGGSDQNGTDGAITFLGKLKEQPKKPTRVCCRRQRLRSCGSLDNAFVLVGLGQPKILGKPKEQQLPMLPVVSDDCQPIVFWIQSIVDITKRGELFN